MLLVAFCFIAANSTGVVKYPLPPPVPLGGGVGVGVGVGVGDAFVQMINETDWTTPESAATLSLTFNVHVPFGFTPSNTDRGLFGVNVPDIPSVQTFSIGLLPDSSSNTVLMKL